MRPSRSAIVRLEATLVEYLPPLHRAALAYAPAKARSAWLGFLALDVRLAAAVRETREPMLAQIRLAWWRERLAEAPAARPEGEPLLALLGPQSERMVPLVNGWEAMLGAAPLPPEAIVAFAEGRARALVGLAVALDCADAAADVGKAGRNWALADFVLHVRDQKERDQAKALITTGKRVALPISMRPLTILEGLAGHDLESRGKVGGIGSLLLTLRLGILGR